MNTQEIQQQLIYLNDLTLQKGFDMGWEAVIEQLELEADNLHNQGKDLPAQAVRNVIKKIQHNH